MGKWGSAVILCGGKSRRMGFDKCSIKIGGKYLIEIIAEELGKLFNEVILVADDDKKFKETGYMIVKDVKKDCGPAGGIYTGLKAASSQHIFVTACDMPFINLGYIKYMIDVIENYNPDCIISRNGKWIEPMYAFYSKSIMDVFESSIIRKKNKLFEIIKGCNIYYIEEEIVRAYCSEKEIFINMNYTEDLDVLNKVKLGSDGVLTLPEPS